MSAVPHPATRGTIYSETAKVVSQEGFPADQYMLRLHAPRTASHARPGQFVHLQCDPSLLHRRPMSILHADPKQGDIDILYKIHGGGHAAAGGEDSGTGAGAVGADRQFL